jgi:flagellar protein FlaG
MELNLETIESKNREITGQESISPPRHAEFPQGRPQEEKNLRSPLSREDASSEPKNIQEVEIEKVSNALEQFWDAMGVSLKFKVDKTTEIIQVEVIDPSSERVIKKIPEDEILHMAASLKESVGFLVDRKF